MDFYQSLENIEFYKLPQKGSVNFLRFYLSEKNSVNSKTGSVSRYMENPELNKSPENKMTIINRDANIS